MSVKSSISAAPSLLSNAASRLLPSQLNEQVVQSAWSALGLYISRQLRMGRAISIPSFGVFNFSAPEISLTGVTNPLQRDKLRRVPVFIISKDFAPGKRILPGIATINGIRPYNVVDNGKIQQTKINYTEIGHYAGLSKDDARISINRVVKTLAEKARNNQNIAVEIPNVGLFGVKNSVAAVEFNQFLYQSTREITTKPLQFKISQGQMNLTKQKLQQFQQINLERSLQEEYAGKTSEFLQIDDKAKSYLRHSLGIEFMGLKDPYRPQSSFFRTEPTTKSQMQFRTRSQINDQKNYFQRPLTAISQQLQPKNEVNQFLTKVFIKNLDTNKQIEIMNTFIKLSH